MSGGSAILVMSLMCCIWPLCVHFALGWIGHVLRGGVRFRSPIVVGDKKGFTGKGVPTYNTPQK